MPSHRVGYPRHRVPRRRVQVAALLIALAAAPWWGRSNQVSALAPAVTTAAYSRYPTPQDPVSPLDIDPPMATMAGLGPAVPLTDPALVSPTTAATHEKSVTFTTSALGSFTYTANADGSINQDPAWVRANITTESVPILGDQTCNKVMFPQLIGAMADLEAQGLAGLIDQPDLRDHQGNCYQARYVDSDPSRGLSYHAWGIAIDLNRSQNPEGLPSHQDPRLVETMLRWGFRWGGIWSRPDPMHFELPNVLLPTARTRVTLAASAASSVAPGSMVSATAEVGGGSNPTGAVVFKLFGPDDPACKVTAAVATAPLAGGHAAASSLGVAAPGTYRLVVSYGGDAGNDPLSTTCGQVVVMVGKASVTMTAAASPASITPGSSARVTAKLAGAPIPAGATLTYLLYGPNDPTCQGSPSLTGLGTSAGPGTYDSGPLGAPQPGSYQWVVSYGGDGINGPLTTPCGAAPLTVGP